MVERQIGQRIQYIRKKRGLTQERLSEMIDVSTNHLSAIERGVYGIKLKTLVKIMLCLECSANDVFADVIKSESLINEYGFTDGVKNLTPAESDLILKLIEQFNDIKRCDKS